MALKDCIRKLGKLIDKDERALLQSWLDEGMSDEAVVQRYQLAAEMDMLDVVRKAKVSGELQVRNPDVRAIIGDYAKAAFDKAEAEYEVVLADIGDLQDEWSRIRWIRDMVVSWTGPQEAPTQENIDPENDQQLLNRLSAIFFVNPDLFRNNQLGGDLLHGNSPLEVFQSWHRMMDRSIEIVRDLEPLVAQKVELENRMEDLDKQRWEDARVKDRLFQGPIDDGKKPGTEREKIQEELNFLDDQQAEAELEAMGASGSTDAGRVLKLLGPALYGDMEKIHKVTIKELFQNAYDAVRTNVRKGAVDEGEIDITVSDDKRSVTVRDNGVGMTPDMINAGFLRVAGTAKEGDINSGGFGIAKVLFLAGNKALKVVTVRDGVKTTLETTGADFAKNMEDPSHSLNPKYPPDRVLRREKTDEPNGTTVTVTMPDEYTDFRTGEVKTIADIRGFDVWESSDKQILDPRIKVTENGRQSPSGKNFRHHEFNVIQQVRFEWGTVDVYMSKDERAVWRENARVSVHGLKQFELGITENPVNPSSDIIKRQFYIDVKPDMDPGEPGYPFNLQRQAFVDHAERDMLQLQAYLAVLNARSKAEQVAQGYGTLFTLTEDGSSGPELKLEPPERQRGGLVERLDEGSMLEVRDGVLVVDGIEQQRITPEEMRDLSGVDTSEYQVDQDLIPNKEPILHNQKKFKDDRQLLLSTHEEYAGSDLMDALYDKFGEERVHKYFYEIGRVFLDTRNLIAVKGDKNMFGGLDKIGAGVSVLGPMHYGVHTKVPGQMMFINPAADPRELRTRAETDGREVPANVTAASMLTTMIHEIAHYAEWSHDNDFIFALQNAMATAIQEPKVMAGLRKRLEDTLNANHEIYRWLADAQDIDSFNNLGNSLQDVGTEQRGTRGDITDPTQPEPRGAERPGAADEVQPGAAAATGISQRDRVAAGYREGGIVAPEGAVNPQAGQNSQLHKLLEDPRTVLEEPDRGIIVDESGNYIDTSTGLNPAEQDGDDMVREPVDSDMYGAAALSGKIRESESIANYKIRVKHEETKQFNIGIDKVETPEDAAHVLAPVRKNAQENFVALVLDEQQKPIAVIHHTKGTTDGAGVFPSVLAGAIHNTKGAKYVWFGHNHPSGKNEPSQADARITKKLQDTLAGTGVTIMGHVIVAAGGKAGRMAADGSDLGPIVPTKARRKKRVPVTERILVAAPSDAAPITGPESMRTMIRQAGRNPGVYLLDNRHRLIGHIALTTEQMENLRSSGGAAAFFQALDATNASAFAMVTPDLATEAVQNIVNFADDFRFLDHLYGDELKSRADQGTIPPKDGRYKQDERGYIDFDDLRRGYIRLTENADFSTFIHETGHLYLEVMRRVAAMEDAPQQIKDDWSKILNFLGVTDGSQITTEHHEKWARAFEKYTMEGKAPSLELQDSFNAFRRWLQAIYRKLTQMANVELTDEVRGVMDRMLASDEQIKLAEESHGFSALFLNAEEARMSQEEFTLYKRRLQAAHDDAVDRETRRLIKAMRRDQLAWWKEQRKAIQAEVEEEAYNTRVYVALAKLQKDQQPNGEPSPTAPFKIDKESLLELVAGDQSMLNRLPKPYIYSRDGGTDVQVAAQMFGYKDAMKMIEEMIKAPKMKAWIKAETDRRMLELYPDPLTDGTLADNAVRAVHDHKRAEILAAELRALRRMVREDRPAVRAAQQAERRQEREAIAANKAQLPSRKEVQMIRAAARQAIAAKEIRNIKPHQYLAAERKAGRMAFEAMRRRDYQAAYKHKMQQINALEMWRAANKAQRDAQAGQRYLSKFNRPTIQRKMGKAGVLEDIQAILEGVDLRRRSLTQVDMDKRLQSLRDDVEKGRFIVTPSTLARIFDDRVNWQDLTLEEFMGMRDLVKQIEHSAVASNKHYVNDQWVDFSEAEADVVESLFENNERIDLRPGGVRTGREQVSKSIDQGIRTWLRPSSIARVLDNAGFGALTRRIIAPMRRAYAEKLIPMLHKAQEDVSKIYQQHYSKAELGQLAKRNIRIESLDRTYSRSEILSVALNWGSQSNRAALLGGVDEGAPVFTQQAVDEMLAHLTAQDWGFVQGIWDYLDTYRDQIFEAEKRRRGVAPQKVEPLPFTIRTADGTEVTLAGGYYPLRYDSSYEAEAAPQDIQDEFNRVAFGSMVTANTRAGATYNRVRNHGKVVRLGLNNIDTHLREVIRDIAIGDETLYIKRLLDSREVRKAFKKTGNEHSLEALNLWLTDAAVGELPSENIWEASTAWIRTGFTKAKLGWNMAVMFLQFTGVFQTIAVIGATHYGRGLGKFMQNPRAAWKHVMETSKFLNARYEIGAWNKDVQDTRAHLESIFGTTPTASKVVMTRLAYTYFLPIAKAQQVVDITTWLGAYHKGLNELELSEADAVIYADTQVEASQTSGFFSDRSGFERGTSGLRKNRQSQWIRIWSTLLSYMLAKGNIAYEKTKSTNFRSPAQIAKYTADMFLLFTVEGMASALLYNRLPEEEDEPEEWAKWTAAVTADSMISGVPYARELLAAKYGGGNTPVGVFLNDSWRLIEQAGQGEADAAAVDAFLDVVGTATHTPTGQISKTYRAIFEDDDTALYEYLFGPSRDD